MEKKMELRVLKYFLAVAREQNITRAAESLHIAQPSLSKQIMELEQELGKQLLIRGKRKITLTEEGRLLRKRAEDILSLVEKTEQEISSDLAEISGEVSIGGTIPQTLLQAASSLQSRYPKVSFQFYSGDATDVTERLEHGNLDFAVLLQPLDTSRYDSVALPDFSVWGVLMPDSSPFAALDSIQRKDLLQMPLILHRRAGLQQNIADWAQTDIGHLHITATYNVVHGSPASFVKNNMGYFLTTGDLLSSSLEEDIVFRPLNPVLQVQYYLVWKRHNVFSRTADLFLQRVRQIIAEKNTGLPLR